MTLLAVLRHGETQWSRDGRIQGRTDVPLNADGRTALALRRLPDVVRNMQVVTSPLRRCVETAQLLSPAGAAVEPRIAEMSWGQWEGRRLEELRSELGQVMVANEVLGLDFRPTLGESPREVLARIGPWLAEVGAQARPVLAITHRGVIRVLFAAATGWDMRGRPPAKLDWGAVHLFRLASSGTPSVVDLNIPLLRVLADGVQQ